MTAADRFTWNTYDTVLRLDFVSFAQRCLRELSPRAQFAMNWHIEIIAAKLMAGARRQDPPADHQHAAALFEVAAGLGRLSGLVSRARPGGADPLRQLRAGARRQIVARLPADPRQRLVSADLPDAAVTRAPGDVRIRDDGAGLPARDLGRGRVDRPR